MNTHTKRDQMKDVNLICNAAFNDCAWPFCSTNISKTPHTNHVSVYNNLVN